MAPRFEVCTQCVCVLCCAVLCCAVLCCAVLCKHCASACLCSVGARLIELQNACLVPGCGPRVVALLWLLKRGAWLCWPLLPRVALEIVCKPLRLCFYSCVHLRLHPSVCSAAQQ